jgi:hypothetical protein
MGNQFVSSCENCPQSFSDTSVKDHLDLRSEFCYITDCDIKCSDLKEEKLDAELASFHLMVKLSVV